MAYEHTEYYFKWLVGRSADVYSQFGEDGLIATALEKVGAVNRWCFEVGANDGVYFSNTKRLRDQGWSAVLIESEAKHYEKLKDFANERVITIHERVTADSLDRILEQSRCPTDVDLGIIDVDGPDYAIWDGLKQYRPRLMLVEFAIEESRDEQAKQTEIRKLGTEKGYTLLAKTYVNLLFCRNDVLA